MLKPLEIVHEDEELLVVNKPAGLVCHPTKAGEHSSLIGRIRLHLGNAARAHLVNRLDRETSGIVIVAKNPEVAGELGKLLESRSVGKEYLAIVHGHVRDEQGMIDAPLGKDERSRVAIKDCVRPDGAAARTEFCIERRFARRFSQGSEEFSLSAREAEGEGRGEAGFTLLRIVPHTGRKHQIRIHLEHIGHPIVGDKLYGGDDGLYLAFVKNCLSPEQRARLILPHHALHARAVRFAWRGKRLEFTCQPEPWFKRFLSADETR